MKITLNIESAFIVLQWPIRVLVTGVVAVVVGSLVMSESAGANRTEVCTLHYAWLVPSAVDARVLRVVYLPDV